MIQKVLVIVVVVVLVQALTLLQHQHLHVAKCETSGLLHMFDFHHSTH